MAIVKKPVVATKPVPAKQPVAKKPEGYEIVDMSTVQLVPKGSGGGGRSLSPFAIKVFSLQNGQGMKISAERYGESGKGLASLYAGAKRRNIKLRARKDINGNIWLFRLSEEEEQEALERAAQREAESTEE
jgi:hypothetical protein